MRKMDGFEYRKGNIVKQYSKILYFEQLKIEFDAFEDTEFQEARRVREKMNLAGKCRERKNKCRDNCLRKNCCMHLAWKGKEGYRAKFQIVEILSKGLNLILQF